MAVQGAGEKLVVLAGFGCSFRRANGRNNMALSPYARKQMPFAYRTIEQYVVSQEVIGYTVQPTQESCFSLIQTGL